MESEKYLKLLEMIAELHAEVVRLGTQIDQLQRQIEFQK